MSARRRTAVASLGLLLAASSCGPAADARTEPAGAAAQVTAAEPVAPVVREILAQHDGPPGAPGRRLTLVRYTIAPGAELAPHTHPGVQMAAMVSGVLTYEVLAGTAVVHRSVDAAGLPATVDTLVGPARTELGPGDAVVEDFALLHFGANRTDRPVVILATLLTEAGAELAVTVAVPDGR